MRRKGVIMQLTKDEVFHFILSCTGDVDRIVRRFCRYRNGSRNPNVGEDLTQDAHLALVELVRTEDDRQFAERNKGLVMLKVKDEVREGYRRYALFPYGKNTKLSLFNRIRAVELREEIMADAVLDQYEPVITEDAFDRVLRCLSHKQQVMVAMRMKGCTMEEIGKAVGQSPSTVFRNLHVIEDQVRNALGVEQEG